jgi:hypothetical protein
VVRIDVLRPSRGDRREAGGVFQVLANAGDQRLARVETPHVLLRIEHGGQAALAGVRWMGADETHKARGDSVQQTGLDYA